MAAILNNQGLAIVIMGVSGTGKTTVAQMLAKSLGCIFIEADDFHSQANKEKMRRAIPLTDEDRLPWLKSLRDAIMMKISNGDIVTLACSALKKEYREILRSADSRYKFGDFANCNVRFICLKAPTEVIAERLKKRSEEGKHFMSADLLQSQLDLLQVDEEEEIPMVDTSASIQAIVDKTFALLSSNGI